MSQNETHFGRIRKLETDLVVEEFFRLKCEEVGVTSIAGYGRDTWERTYQSEISDQKYFVLNNQIWEVVDHVSADDDDLDVFIPSSDGSYIFVYQFYNGGTCFGEVMEENLQKIKTS